RVILSEAKDLRLRKLRSFAVFAAQDDTAPRVSLPVLNTNLRFDSAANIEIALDFDEARIERANEIVGDAIRDRLVKRALIAIRPEIQLERFQLDAFLIGNVANANRREVRLPRHRTDARKLRRFEVDLVIAFGTGIWKRLEIF